MDKATERDFEFQKMQMAIELKMKKLAVESEKAKREIKVMEEVKATRNSPACKTKLYVDALKSTMTHMPSDPI